MHYDPFLRNNQGIHYVESATLDQDAAAIEQLRLGWQQFRAMQQQIITIEFLSDGSPLIDESKCVEGSISEVPDVRS